MRVADRLDVVARAVDIARISPDSDAAAARLAQETGVSLARAKGALLLGRELGFIDGVQKLTVSNAGVKFANYYAVGRTEVSPEPARIQATTPTSQVCASLPPFWRAALREELGDLVEPTEEGERLVVESAKRTLYIVSAFLDPNVLLMKLNEVHAPEIDVIVLTSDPKLVKEYPGGNWIRQRLFEILQRRFRNVRIHHFEDRGMIVHAKLWVSEGGVFLTSANLSADSATDNFELGVFSGDPALTSVFKLLIDRVIAMQGVTCLRP